MIHKLNIFFDEHDITAATKGDVFSLDDYGATLAFAGYLQNHTTGHKGVIISGANPWLVSLLNPVKKLFEVGKYYKSKINPSFVIYIDSYYSDEKAIYDLICDGRIVHNLKIGQTHRNNYIEVTPEWKEVVNE